MFWPHRAAPWGPFRRGWLPKLAESLSGEGLEKGPQNNMGKTRKSVPNGDPIVAQMAPKID